MARTTTNRAEKGQDHSKVPDPEVPERASRRVYSPRYKLDILAEYEGLEQAEKGSLLRREGLYTSLISTWRKQRDQGALEALRSPGRPSSDPKDREIARLKKRTGILQEELDRAHQVIEVQGKLYALFEQLATSSAAHTGGEPPAPSPRRPAR